LEIMPQTFSSDAFTSTLALIDTILFHLLRDLGGSLLLTGTLMASVFLDMESYLMKGEGTYRRRGISRKHHSYH
jgi:inner membrane protein involved in colicin E2 resistance